MKNEVRTTRTLWYFSEVNPTIETRSEELSKIIEWADENPVAYEIVNSNKSSTFGLNASCHLGWAQGSKSPEAILERLGNLYQDLEILDEGRAFWKSRAEFTLEHFSDKNFTGGFFQQWDLYHDGNEYPRSCVYMDYTPSTLESVIDRFCEWMEQHYKNVTRITVNKENVRTFEPHFSMLQESLKKAGKLTKPVRGRKVKKA